MRGASIRRPLRVVKADLGQPAATNVGRLLSFYDNNLPNLPEPLPVRTPCAVVPTCETCGRRTTGPAPPALHPPRRAIILLPPHRYQAGGAGGGTVTGCLSAAFATSRRGGGRAGCVAAVGRRRGRTAGRPGSRRRPVRRGSPWALEASGPERRQPGPSYGWDPRPARTAGRVGPGRAVRVGRAGLEPATPRPPVWCATKLRHRPVSAEPTRSRRAHRRRRAVAAPDDSLLYTVQRCKWSLRGTSYASGSWDGSV